MSKKSSDQSVENKGGSKTPQRTPTPTPINFNLNQICEEEKVEDDEDEIDQ